jgi:hypothetical protein
MEYTSNQYAKTEGCHQHVTNRLHLQTLGSQLIMMPKNFPNHWWNLSSIIVFVWFLPVLLTWSATYMTLLHNIYLLSTLPPTSNSTCYCEADETPTPPSIPNHGERERPSSTIPHNWECVLRAALHKESRPFWSQILDAHWLNFWNRFQGLYTRSQDRK